MDTNVIRRARDRDKEAFTSLVMHFGDQLYAVAYRILRDAARAEDAVQQTFLTAWRELPRLRDDRSLRGLAVHAVGQRVVGPSSGTSSAGSPDYTWSATTSRPVDDAQLSVATS